MNVNVWVAKEALTLISQRLGNFRLNGCLIKLCWRENNPCLPGALRKEKEKKERNEKNAQGCSPMQTPPKFNLVAQSLPRTAPTCSYRAILLVLESGEDLICNLVVERSSVQ